MVPGPVRLLGRDENSCTCTTAQDVMLWPYAPTTQRLDNLSLTCSLICCRGVVLCRIKTKRGLISSPVMSHLSEYAWM